MQIGYEQFDWRARETWRAFLAIAAFVGAFAAVAAVLSESLVRYMFGMPLRDELGWGDPAALGIAMLVVAMAIWVWERVLGFPKVRDAFRTARYRRGARDNSQFKEWGILIGWGVLVMTSYFLPYLAVNSAFDIDAGGSMTSFVAVYAISTGRHWLLPGLERFGARRNSNPQLAQ